MNHERYCRRLSAAEAEIGKLAAGLSSVESRVAQLQEDLAEHSRGAAALQLRAEATEARLATARALLKKLDTEHQDWQTQLEELTARKERLDVEAANVASLLVYEVRAMSFRLYSFQNFRNRIRELFYSFNNRRRNRKSKK